MRHFLKLLLLAGHKMIWLTKLFLDDNLIEGQRLRF
jgi:hypothetical protein